MFQSEKTKIGLLVGAALGSTAAHGAAPQKQPHIIFIMTDQQRADAMGCSGNAAVLSPNLDRLAAEGYRFANAYSSTPSSTPARASLLTGMSPWHHGLLGYSSRIGEQYKYEGPQMIKDLGYRTMAIGKNHWHPQTARHGYEVVLTDESGRTESPDYVSDYRKWFNVQAFGLNPDSTHVGWNAHEGKAYALPERLHPTVWTADRAIEAIHGYCDDKPLMLKVSFARPHSPYDAPQRLVDMYKGREIPAAVVGEWCEERPLDNPDANPEAAVGHYTDEYIENSRRHYYASVTFIDEQVGRIVDELKAKGMYDDALILYVSDHGDMLGDHNLWRKTYAYEGSANVPFIVKLPAAWDAAAERGAVMEQPVELRDILPTFLEAAGSQAPADMDGRSILPLVQTSDAEWRDFIDLEHARSYFDENNWAGLTDGKIKYVWFFPTGEEQLFDLQADPGETKNLANAPKAKKTLERMRKALADHLEERGEEWSRDGKPVVRKKSMLYTPNFPKSMAQK